MSTISDLEASVLNLPAGDRARLVLKAWASLADDPAVGADPHVDPEGVRLACARDADIEPNGIRPLDHRQFRKLTGGDE